MVVYGRLLLLLTILLIYDIIQLQTIKKEIKMDYKIRANKHTHYTNDCDDLQGVVEVALADAFEEMLDSCYEEYELLGIKIKPSEMKNICENFDSARDEYIGEEVNRIVEEMEKMSDNETIYEGGLEITAFDS